MRCTKSPPPSPANTTQDLPRGFPSFVKPVPSCTDCAAQRTARVSHGTATRAGAELASYAPRFSCRWSFGGLRLAGRIPRGGKHAELGSPGRTKPIRPSELEEVETLAAHLSNHPLVYLRLRPDHAGPGASQSSATACRDESAGRRARRGKT